MNVRRAFFRLALVLCWSFLTYFFYVDYVTDVSYLKQKVALSLAIVLLVVVYGYQGEIKNKILNIKNRVRNRRDEG